MLAGAEQGIGKLGPLLLEPSEPRDCGEHGAPGKGGSLHLQPQSTRSFPACFTITHACENADEPNIYSCAFICLQEHWLTVRRVHDSFYNFNSLYGAPGVKDFGHHSLSHLLVLNAMTRLGIAMCINPLAESVRKGRVVGGSKVQMDSSPFSPAGIKYLQFLSWAFARQTGSSKSPK